VTDLSKLWTDADPDRKDVILFLAYIEPPVSIDFLGSLSEISFSKILHAIEALKKKRLLWEKKEYGPGLYFYDGTVLKDLAGNAAGHESARVMARLIDYYKVHENDDHRNVLTLASLYRDSGNIEDGLGEIKKAADLLHKSGEREKAAAYYDGLVRYFETRPVERSQAACFLDSVLAIVAIMKYRMPVHEQITLLIKAEQIARGHRQWEALSKVKLALARLFQASGHHRQATLCINDFRNLAKKTGDPSVVRIATLLTSEFLYWQGRFSDAALRYDEAIGDVEEFGDDKATLKAGARVGFSNVICGRIARGMGMIDAVRAKGLALNIQSVVAFADFMAALALFEIRKLPEGSFFLDRLSLFLEEVLGHYVLSGMNRCKAFLCCMRQEYEEAFQYHKKAIGHSLAVGWNHHNGPWNLECLDILESKGFFNAQWNYDGEIERMLHWDDIYMKGAAFRYRALRTMKRGGPPGAVLADLTSAEKYLKRAGAEIELARTWIDLGSFHMKQGEAGLGQSFLTRAWVLFSKVDRSLLPKDLLVVMPQEQRIELMIERIIKINESLGGILSTSSFLERVINVAMDFTMATRGAFFSVGEGEEPRIVTSRNLNPLHTAQSGLISMAVEQAVREGKGLVFPGFEAAGVLTDRALGGAGITAFLCMPARLGEETMGYLYLDNRLGGRPFPEDLLTYVRLLCSQIAVGLSNIRIYDEIKNEKARLEDETVFYKRTMGVDGSPGTIIAKSEAIRTVIDQIRQVGPTDSTVLIMGETGVGKELVAKAIHALSDRRDGPFIPVNLAVLPHDLVANELFGHEKGAFTGAGERHKGRFELAHGGTIFLDEIGDLPPDIQVKLLRVLQEGAFERLGSEKPVKFDFRVIVATHRNLDIEVEKGAFRQDLYYRLNVFPIYMPPLRDRKEDIPLLAQHFVDEFARKMHKRINRIPAREMKKLMEYHWPGNVRELEHFVERAVIISDGKDLSFSGHGLKGPEGIRAREPGPTLLADVERLHIEKVLSHTRGKVGGPDGAAALLGLKPTTLFFRIKKLGITRPS
jgi:transcriptional regulator with GAF, ATPase, and Fis domain/tetratricopeptide (TPR) repeat protein